MKGLGLGLGLTGKGGTTPNPLCEAIGKRVFVTAIEGNGTVTFAPHVVYVRAKDQWVAGAEAGEGKLRTWKVSKLSNIALTAEPFTPASGFDPHDPQFGDEIICRLSL